jgi:hypothetical protein
VRYRRLTESGDYSFGQGRLEYQEGLQAVMQAIKTKLLLLKSEWWEELEDGLPLFQKILLQRGTEEGLRIVELTVRDRIMDTPHVLDVTSYEADYDRNTRKYTATITVSTDYGNAATIYELEVSP